MVARKYGPYEIRHALGEGGMGEVYAAYDARLGRNVALKVLRVHNEECRQRMLREARAAASINHPNVCQIFDG